MATKKTKTSNSVANDRYEKKIRSWVTGGFADPGGPWASTTKRLVMAYNGKYHRNYQRRNRFVVNTIFSIVQLLLPNLMFQLPYIKVNPLNAKYFKTMPDGSKQPMDAVTSAQIREASLNHRLKKINAFGEFTKCIMDALFGGYGICKAGYSYETVTEMDTDYVVKDTPFLKRIDTRDFGRHPLATGMDDSPFFSHRLYMTKEMIKDKYDVKEDILEKMESCTPQHIKDRLEAEGKNRGKFSASDLAEEYTALVELHDMERNTLELRSADGAVKLTDTRKDPYDFEGSHFTRIKLVGDNEKFEGISLLSTVEDQALVLNELLTLMIEHVRKFPAQIFLQKNMVDEGDVERIRTGEQGSIHVLASTSGIERVPALSMGNDYQLMVRMLQDIIDRTLGIPDFQRGVSSSRQSATEASLIHGDASVRRDYYLDLIKIFVMDSVKRVSWLDQQYQDKQEEIMTSGVAGGDPITWDKTDIQGDWGFDFDITSLRASNEMQLNAITNLISVIGKVPLMEPIIASFNPLKLGAALFKYSGMNIESFQWSPSDPQFQQVIGTIADRMMAMGQAAMGAGVPPQTPAQGGIPTLTPETMPNAPGEAPAQG